MSDVFKGSSASMAAVELCNILVFQPAQPQKDRSEANRHPRQSGHYPEGHRHRQCYNARVTLFCSVPFCSVAVMFGSQATSYEASILDLRKLMGPMSETKLPVEMVQDEMPVAIVIVSNKLIQVRRAINALVVV